MDLMNSEMPAAIVGAVLGALLGTIGGAVVTAWATNRANQLSATQDMIANWHSSDMRKDRCAAEEALKTNTGLAAAFDRASENDKHALSMVAHFADVLAILAKKGRLAKDLARPAFAVVVNYWAPLLLANTDLKTYRGEWRPLLLRVSKLRELLPPPKGE